MLEKEKLVAIPLHDKIKESVSRLLFSELPSMHQCITGGGDLE
jgi:hypothetical protein